MDFWNNDLGTILCSQETVCHTGGKLADRQGKGRVGSAPGSVGMGTHNTDRPPGRAQK